MSRLLFTRFGPDRRRRTRSFALILLLLPALLLVVIKVRSVGAQAVVAFSSQTTYNVGAGPYWTATFTKFGKPAIAVTNQEDNSVSVLYSNYSGQFNGTFGSAITYNLVTASVPVPQPKQVVAGNLGQLPLPCLVIAAANANKVAVLLGNSDDSFQTAPVYYNVGNFPESVALGDVNGDGNLDIIAANYGSSTVSVLLGNSDRTFQAAQTYATSPNPESVVVADFNNDAKLDIATANSGTNPGKVNVLLNANGTFANTLTSDVGLNPFSLAVGDFNKDGRLDIVTANNAGGVSVLLNNGVRPFPTVAPASIPAGNGPFSVAVADFNLDGQADIAVANSENGGGSVSILPNNNGSFQALQGVNSFSTGAGPFFIAVGDFNVDGKPDVVAPNHPNPVVNPGTISVLLNTALPFASPPPNDNFSAAQNLNSAVSGRVTGINIGATREPNEPNHAGFGFGFSVWYSWTAPANGAVTFDTFGSSFNTVLAAYKGTDVSTLTPLAGNDDDSSPSNDLRRSSRVRFRAEAGTTYRIAVDGGFAFDTPNTGDITLNWYLLPPPTNDLFANAETITGTSVSIATTNAGATKEAGESNHGGNTGGASIWYRWVAPASDNFTITTAGSQVNCSSLCPYDTLLAVYTGSSLQQLSLVNQNDNNSDQVTSRVAFQAQTGTTYYIAVDSKGTAGGDISLRLLPTLLSANDTSGNPVIVSGFSGSASTAPGPSNGEAWFLWTAPAGGSASFTSQPFSFPPPPQGFANQSPSILTAFNVDASGNPSTQIVTRTGECRSFSFIQCDSTTINFTATATSRYFLRIQKSSLSSLGSGSLSWFLPQTPAPPANDNFSNAISIAGFTGNASFTNLGATKEAGEPGAPGGHSVWYNWTAPANFTVVFDAGSFTLGVFNGSAVNTLTSVASGTGAVTFVALQGTNYRISIDSLSTGSRTLEWKPSTPPPNDNFANAQLLNTASGSVQGHNVNATAETGEPNHAGPTPAASVWYRWTAPSTGFVTFKTDGSRLVNNRLAIYTGSNLSNLSPVVVDLNSCCSDIPGTVTFFATVGTTYQIAVDGLFGLTDSILLAWGTPRTISGRIADIRGAGIANIQVTLSGDASRKRTTDSQGKFSFSDLVQGGNYIVTPAITSFTFDFDSRTYNPLTTDITDANFVAQTPTYFITGKLTKGSVALANIRVNLEGTDIPANTFVQTTAEGKYTFTDLKTDGDYKVTPSSPDFTFSATIFPSENSYSFKTLNQPVSNADFNGNAFSRSLTVASLNPASGVTIQISPADKTAQGNGPTPLTRVYDSGQLVNLIAPPTAGINTFQKWLRDGVDFSANTTTSVTMDANHSMTAVYVTPTRTLTVASTNVAGGVSITVSPNDNNNQGAGTTQFTRTYDLNKQVTLTALANSGNSSFQKWQKDGADYSNSLSTDVTMDANHTMTAVYLITSAQTSTGQNVAVQLNGVTVTFANVGTAGTTTITPISPASAGQLPSGYQLTGNIMAFDISTTASVQPPISICFNVPSVTDPALFAQLRILHGENGTLEDRTTSQDFGAKMVCATVNSLSPFVLVSTTVQQLQLLLEESATPPTQVVALDNILRVRDPFPAVNPSNLLMGADKTTRVMVFVKGLSPGDTAAAIKVHLAANGQSYEVTPENLFSLANFDFSQVTFRLPDALTTGTYTIEVRAHGLVSNLGTFRIK